MKSRDLKRLYIQKAYELVRSEGKGGVSIRRLAKELDCNLASLYRCFHDIDELFLYVGFKYLKDYLIDVQDIVPRDDNSLELYFETWNSFIEYSFKNPKMFDALFFSKYEDKMDFVVKDYYSLFPEEVLKFDEGLKKIFINGNLEERNLMMLRRCVDEGLIDEENVGFLNKLIIQMYKGYLKDFLDERLMCDSEKDVTSAKDELMTYYKNIVSGYVKKSPANSANT